MNQTRLSAHDANQLEVELSYHIDPGQKKQHYLVETYLFVPKTLWMSPQSYNAQSFFEDFQTFVRLKPPTVSLEALSQGEGVANWLNPVRAAISQGTYSSPEQLTKLTRDMRLLASIYGESIQESRLALQQQAAPLLHPHIAPAPSPAAFIQATSQWHTALRAALSQLTALEAPLKSSQPPDSILETWQACDEFVALSTEENATHLVQLFDDTAASIPPEQQPDWHKARTLIAQLSVDARRYRRLHDHRTLTPLPASTPTNPSADAQDDASLRSLKEQILSESFLRHRQVIKRAVTSVLFLDMRAKEGGMMQRDIIAGAAAATAMLVTTLMLIWAQARYAQLSLLFLIFAVFTYIVKDRLKERVRQSLGRRFSSYLPDYVTEIREPSSGQVIGQLREAASLISASKVPAEFMEVRHQNNQSVIERQGRPEMVVRYVKEVTLDSQGLANTRLGVDGLSDLMRFNFVRLRHRMDDPWAIRTMLDPDTLAIKHVRYPRVYHVNMVWRIVPKRTSLKQSHLHAIRLVLDAERLRRVETISQPAPPDTPPPDLASPSSPAISSNVSLVQDADMPGHLPNDTPPTSQEATHAEPPHVL